MVRGRAKADLQIRILRRGRPRSNEAASVVSTRDAAFMTIPLDGGRRLTCASAPFFLSLSCSRSAVAWRLPTASTAYRIFIPGNHDWGSPGKDRLMRQQEYVGAIGAEFIPCDGCPGPNGRTPDRRSVTFQRIRAGSPGSWSVQAAAFSRPCTFSSNGGSGLMSGSSNLAACSVVSTSSGSSLISSALSGLGSHTSSPMSRH